MVLFVFVGITLHGIYVRLIVHAWCLSRLGNFSFGSVMDWIFVYVS